MVNRFFAKLAETPDFRVETLENLKEAIVSGSYIESYTTRENGIPYLRVADIKPFSFDENEEDLAYVFSSVPEKIKTQLTILRTVF